MAKAIPGGALTQADLARFKKLTDTLREKQAECFELTEEINRLLNGEAGIGDKLKAVEAAFSLAWADRYAPGNPKAYQWAYVQDRPQIKRLLKTLTVEEIGRRMHDYIRDGDLFYVKARHPFKLFVSAVNRYAVDQGAIDELSLDSPAPSDCAHLPHCGSDQEHTKRRMAEHRA